VQGSGILGGCWASRRTLRSRFSAVRENSLGVSSLTSLGAGCVSSEEEEAYAGQRVYSLPSCS
jgi:hypothetical protein